MPAPLPAPPLSPEEASSFVALERPEPVHRIRSFVSGEPDGERLRVSYWHAAATGEVRARVWLGPGAEGPPGHGHGGALAAILDEVMGVCAWQRGHMVVAKKIAVEYHAPLPLGLDVVARASIASVEGRKVEVVGQIGVPALGDPAVYTTSSGLFIVVMDSLRADFESRLRSETR